MRKGKAEVEDEFGELHFFSGEDADAIAFGQDGSDVQLDDAERRRPARQRLELRNEQRSLRQQLSDWDDYNDDFDTDL